MSSRSSPPARSAAAGRIERSVSSAIGGTADPLAALRSSVAAIVKELGCVRGVVWRVEGTAGAHRSRLVDFADGGANDDEARLLALRLPVGGSSAGVLEILAPAGTSGDDLRDLLGPTLVQLGQCVDRMSRAAKFVEATALLERTGYEGSANFHRRIGGGLEPARRDAEVERLSAELETSAALLEEQATAVAGTPQVLSAEAGGGTAAMIPPDDLRSRLVDAAPVGVFGMSPTGGDLTFLNGRACQILGRSRETLLREGWASFVHPEDRASVFETWEQNLRAGSPHRIENRLLGPDGTIVWVLAEVAPLRDADGTITGWVGTLTDCTAEKINQEALRESEQRIAQAQKISGLGVYAVDPATRETTVSETVAEIFGLPPDASDFFERAVERIHPEDRDTVMAAFEAAMRGEGRFESVFRVNRTDGSERVVRSHAQLVGSRMVGTLADITEERRTQLLLSRAQEIAHLGSWDWNIVTGDLAWTDEIYRIFGLEPQKFAASYEAFLERVHPEDRAAVEREVAEALERHTPYEIEHRIITPGGEERVVHEKGEVTYAADGTPLRMLGTVFDVTERARARKSLERANDDLEAAERIQSALRRVAEGVAEGRDPDDIAAQAAREAAVVARAGGAAVVRMEGTTGVVVGGWARTGLPVPRVGVQVDLSGDLPVAVALRSGLPTTCGDLALTESVPLWDLDQFGSAVAAPVVAEGEPWGAVVAATRRDERLLEGAESRLAQIADLVGLAVASADGRERVVSEAAAAMFGGLSSVEDVLQSLVVAARRALRADRASCYLHSPDETIDQVFTTETNPKIRRYLEGAVGRGRAELPIWTELLEEPEPVLAVGDVASDPSISAEIRRSLRSGAFLGVRLEHASIGSSFGFGLAGTLFLSFAEPRSFTRRQRDIARSLGSLASMAVANARLHAATLESLAAAEERADMDPLTGLMNHRTFQEKLAIGYQKAIEAGGAPSVAVFDIDGFATINATHGHAVGDRVLSEVARRLKSALGDAGAVARVGGEEFAVLISEGSKDDRWERVQAARAAVSSSPVERVATVTVSAGIADVEHAQDAGDLYRLACGALYWAKTHGRDVAFRYTPEVVEVLSPAEQAERLQRSQALQSMRVLARAVDAKDPSTAEHSERVADLAVALATALGWNGVGIAQLREAGLVHDVGKIAIPDAILFKLGFLDSDEFERIKTHAAIGAQMVDGVLDSDQVRWVRGHHERWDGAGYPDRLAAEEIPAGARIIALADAWDVMTSERPYKAEMARDDAMAEVKRGSGSQFWPDAVDALGRLLAAGALPVDMSGDR